MQIFVFMKLYTVWNFNKFAMLSWSHKKEILWILHIGSTQCDIFTSWTKSAWNSLKNKQNMIISHFVDKK